MTWRIEPIEGSFAAAVEGPPLDQAVDDDVVERLRGGLDRHGLLILRGQLLNEPTLLAFAKRFGEPDHIVRDDWASRQCPEITYITNLLGGDGRPLGGLGSGEIDWHSDQSYMPSPATGSFLYGVEIPPEGTPTYFASLYLAHEALPAATRAHIEGLKVVYSYAKRVSTYEGRAAERGRDPRDGSGSAPSPGTRPSQDPGGARSISIRRRLSASKGWRRPRARRCWRNSRTTPFNPPSSMPTSGGWAISWSGTTR